MTTEISEGSPDSQGASTNPFDLSTLGTPPGSSFKLLLIVFPLLILSVLEHGIALPILPVTARFFEATPIEIGLLFSIQYFGQFMMSPAWGWLSDRFGRKKIFIVTLLTGGLAELLTALSPNLTVLLIGRLLVGLTAGNLAIASALMSDMTTEKERSKGMALVGISYGIGFVIGPPIGGIAASIGKQEMAGMFHLGLPFFVAAVVLFIAALLAMKILPTPDRYANITEWNHKVAELRAAELAARKHVSEDDARKQNIFPFISAVLMCLLFLGYATNISVVETRLSPYLVNQFQLDPKQIGTTFAGVGLVLLLMQGSVTRLSKYISDFNLILVGGLVAGIGYIIASFTGSSYGLFFAFLCVTSIGRGFFFPGMLSQASKCYDSPKKTGRVMGFFNSFGSLGRIIGPLLGGWIAENFEPHTPFFSTGVAVTVLTILWMLSWRIAQRTTGYVKNE